jgi:hypothetical protein
MRKDRSRGGKVKQQPGRLPLLIRDQRRCYVLPCTAGYVLGKL